MAKKNREKTKVIIALIAFVALVGISVLVYVIVSNRRNVSPEESFAAANQTSGLETFGPCYHNPGGSCSFDTRTFTETPSAPLGMESITANGRVWNYRKEREISEENGEPVVSSKIKHVPCCGFGIYISSVPRYKEGPCARKKGADCVFDTKVIATNGLGEEIESITTSDKLGRGLLWNYNKSQGHKIVTNEFGISLADIPRYNSPGGPCHNRNACAFDTRLIYTNDRGQTFESITAYGKLWEHELINKSTDVTWQYDIGYSLDDFNFYPVQGYYGVKLSDIPKYKEGPCKGKTRCSFETRVISKTENFSDRKPLESITAYGKVWNFYYESNKGLYKSIERAPGFGTNVSSVPRYRDGLATEM